MKPSCQTLSKALEMSGKAARTSKDLGSSKASWISLTRNNNWFIVESPESKEALVPLSKTRLGWSVTMRSIHDGFLPGSKFVGSDMICNRFNEVDRSSISLPSASGHQNWECALKSQKVFQL